MSDLDDHVDRLLAEKAKRSKRARGSKRKGSKAERDVAAMLVEVGFADCRRAFASGAQGGGDLVGVPGYHFEIKRVERLDLGAAWRQACAACSASEVPVVAHKRSRQEWMATLPLKDLLALIAPPTEDAA